MRIDVVCFTRHGHALGEKLRLALGKEGDVVSLARCGGDGGTVHDWARKHFPVAAALIYIGAAGIAVRSLAPLVAAKTSDPAVLVIDEKARFVIPILSGHIGGANALAGRVAAMLGAVAAITTATDVHGKFAVDSWAKRHGLFISNPEAIKSVSSKLLRGETVRLSSAFPIVGALPEGVEAAEGDCDIRIGIDASPPDGALHLVPPAMILGIGCRRDTPSEMIEEAFAGFCTLAELCPRALHMVCSIDRKSDEAGLVAFCEKRAVPFVTFSADKLAAVPGVFAASGFVERITGVDNVCERSAVLGGGVLRIGKTVLCGVAMAVAVRPFQILFTTDTQDAE